MGKNIKAGKRTFKLEDMVKPETFFDLGCWSSGRIGNKVTSLTISENHMYLANRLKESGIFRVNYTQIHRGLLVLGLLAECLHNNIYEKKAANIIKKSKTARQQSNAKEINQVVGYLEKNDESDIMLLQNYMKYGKSRSVANLANFIPNLINVNSKPYGSIDKIVIPSSIKQLCNSFSKEPPNDNKYKLKRDKTNERIIFWLPNHIKIITFGLLKSGIVNTRLMSDIYRSGYITGLYVMCRWIVEGKIPLEEYLYCKSMHDIYDYLTDNV